MAYERFRFAALPLRQREGSGGGCLSGALAEFIYIYRNIYSAYSIYIYRVGNMNKARRGNHSWRASSSLLCDLPTVRCCCYCFPLFFCFLFYSFYPFFPLLSALFLLLLPHTNPFFACHACCTRANFFGPSHCLIHCAESGETATEKERERESRSVVALLLFLLSPSHTCWQPLLIKMNALRV